MGELAHAGHGLAPAAQQRRAVHARIGREGTFGAPHLPNLRLVAPHADRKPRQPSRSERCGLRLRRARDRQAEVFRSFLALASFTAA